jgi:predicted RNA binding protein YcfA (HicA-like mRNA interferase family)
MNGKELIKILEKNGFKHVRTTGSHHIMWKEGVERSIPVPVHSSHDIGKGLANKILKQAGLK